MEWDGQVRRLQLVPKAEERAEEKAGEKAAPEDASDPGPVPDRQDRQDNLDASQVIGQAVMYAAMSWMACCIEQTAIEVNVARVGAGVFDAEVKLANGQSQWLRVTLALEYGPRLRTLVEPMHP